MVCKSFFWKMFVSVYIKIKAIPILAPKGILVRPSIKLDDVNIFNKKLHNIEKNIIAINFPVNINLLLLDIWALKIILRVNSIVMIDKNIKYKFLGKALHVLVKISQKSRIMVEMFLSRISIDIATLLWFKFIVIPTNLIIVKLNNIESINIKAMRKISFKMFLISFLFFKIDSSNVKIKNIFIVAW